MTTHKGMEKTDRIYKKNNENSVKNSFKIPTVLLPRTRRFGDEKGMQENRMQRMEPTEDEEEEEEEDENVRSSEPFVNSGRICAACHLAISSANPCYYEQEGHLLCHRCYTKRSAESRNSPTCSRTSSCNSSLVNVQSRISATREQFVQQKKTKEIYANPRNHNSTRKPIAAVRMSHYEGLNRTDSMSEWGSEYGDQRNLSVHEARQFQQKSYCSIIRKNEPQVSNSEMRVNGQIVSECSRRPIRCPRLDCAMTVALSALTHHFLFDHPEVPILNVEPEAKSTLIVSFASLTYGSTKCLALLLVSGKLSGAAANLFNGSQIHAKYRNRLPLPVLAARLKCIDQYGTRDEIRAGGEGHDRGDVIIAWVAGLDFSSPASGVLRCSIQAVDGLESEGFRSLTYSGPINSLRTAQRPLEVFTTGDCVVLHQGLVNQISSGCTNLIVNVIVH